ncbi:AbfB domain-containing protein [Actinoplanes oblitus]|uniref:AbfB domain-containing protein n=1 Tax=Actinoplanes oblitus TaxID=3040509 RepID=A0ABY8WLZ6_9ACTN|nr:AbfB domain-containing protein [Actinoplanes oblitus]WIM98497.1 AbfB domain-containing protein [Actinoplanes oblitus]
MPEAPHSDRRPLLALTAATVIAVLGYAAAATVMLHTQTTLPGGVAAPTSPAWVLPVATAPASPPVSIAPAPSSRAATPSPIRGGTRPVSASSRPVRAGKTAQQKKPAPVLVVGSTIGLGPLDLPGYRLRHRNFVARVDVITARSGPLDRLDSRFTVRAGRADTRCVSFESVNYPGYFLRHRDFYLLLDRADGSELFDRDATLCPAPVTGGFVLRSANYPDRYVVLAGGWVRLDRVAAAQATGFRALPAL